MLDPSDDPQHVLSVSDLNLRARQALEADLGEQWIEGELSGVSRPASGHLYFTLKDERAQVKAVLFRTRARFVSTPMRDGDLVRVRARVSLFEPRGDYQLIVEAVQAAGAGALLAALEALKTRLANEGVFTNARPLAYPPRHLLVLSSATGAALRDVLAVLSKRWPLTTVTLIAVPVQGAEAAPAIIAALSLLNRQPALDPAQDVVLITRGGGSLEDLWAFNDEHLARAIHHSRLPVMSAVGHETDQSLSDLAADASAPTPSAAAERLVPSKQELVSQLRQLEGRLKGAQLRHLQREGQRLDHLRARLRHPGEAIVRQRQTLDQLRSRMARAMAGRMNGEQQRYLDLTRRLALRSPQRAVAEHHKQLTDLKRRLVAAQHQQLTRQRQRLSATVRELQAVSPLAVLARGYSILTNPRGEALTQASQTHPGEHLQARLQEGVLHLEVIDTAPASERSSTVIDPGGS
ncbi:MULTISPECIES: exodeoxyribonuclease VII large subunit [Halomonas]|uniref:exodeoxyribonuclease VII large subunit n=1 Tax=Halomonas TaxID=2745 RepID=UPI001C956A48|nr:MULTISPECIES: exodeoxyribonuclease VII large subunit [Halomonas]MBY6209635.1 exodeoxyribonuclease VII large subunit [Halomonas sp. DP3Y7-2]MBY6226816.1 exodeoxyribonuclease VII large subunit [Halomonas sp. DP3Y7-1]MCA0915437.1 exodeoxyribonuclease VII large subunit [Halomonas denitrificans]